MASQFIGSFGALGVDFTQYSTAQLTDLITRASRKIDAYCRQTFSLTNVTEERTGNGTNILRLLRYPLAQLSTYQTTPPAAAGIGSSIVCDTTITAGVAAGAASCHVTNIANFLPGQFLQWGDSLGEPGNEIAPAGVVADASPAISGTLTLLRPFTYAHSAGARVAVNTIDFITILTPGMLSLPVWAAGLVVNAAEGSMINYTPLLIQSINYTTTFPRRVPMAIRYTYGYLGNAYPDALKEACASLCLVMAGEQAQIGALNEIRLGEQMLRWPTRQNPHPLAIPPEITDMLEPFMRGGPGFA